MFTFEENSSIVQSIAGRPKFVKTTGIIESVEKYAKAFFWNKSKHIVKPKTERHKLDYSDGISKIVVPEYLSKNGLSCTMFMSSEATKLLKQYLTYRKKALHENITEESYVN
ncbi:MAG: hypothetical protein HA495_00280 [Thaumarchaeota archaeon]|nr:hypothetical protein [Nitrososphaerota archaeon]